MNRNTGRRYVTVVESGEKRTLLLSRFLMEKNLGRRLARTEHVDHVDEDKTNDCLENLQVLSIGDHARKTRSGKRSPLKGVDRGWKHGTRYGWDNKECACDECAAVKRMHMDRRNADRRVLEARGPYRKDRDHETRTMYRIGCRCDACRAHNAARARALRESKKSADVG